MQTSELRGVVRGKPQKATRPGTPVPAGQGEPPVPGTGAEQALGRQLDLYLDPAGLRLRRTRPLFSNQWRTRSRSSTPTLTGGLSAGGHRDRCDPSSCSMRSSRPCANAAPARIRFLTRTVDLIYLSLRYTERLAEAGLDPSVGGVGDSSDNALAETITGLFKAEAIHRLGPWKSAEAVEWEALKIDRPIQPTPPPRADPEHPTRRSRKELL